MDHKIEDQRTITSDYRSIQQFYEQDAVWRFDLWHTITRRRIKRFLRHLPYSPSADVVIANVGSGGDTYQVHPSRQLHVDIVLRRLLGRKALVGDVHAVPLRSEAVDAVICVGSVLNHGDPEVALTELVRILRPGGYLVLEFDSSDGLHHLKTGLRHSAQAHIDTFYNKQMVALKEYSFHYIADILRSLHMRVCRRESFHILSAAALAIGFPPALASLLAAADHVAQLSRHLRTAGSNIILLARR